MPDDLRPEAGPELGISGRVSAQHHAYLDAVVERGLDQIERGDQRAVLAEVDLRVQVWGFVELQAGLHQPGHLLLVRRIPGLRRGILLTDDKGDGDLPREGLIEVAPQV